jgi:hypothetical protein
MLTAQRVSDRCSDNDRPSVAEVAEHFRDTIFWNWAEGVADGLDDESRIDCEFPLAVCERPPDEDGQIERNLVFESGECSITVATAYEGTSDETAREVDAHFIANLPVYMPAMFRRIKELVAENTALRNEVATGNLGLVKRAEDAQATLKATEQQMLELQTTLKAVVRHVEVLSWNWAENLDKKLGPPALPPSRDTGFVQNETTIHVAQQLTKLMAAMHTLRRSAVANALADKESP